MKKYKAQQSAISKDEIQQEKRQEIDENKVL